MSTRSCASCGTANEADARFCEGCGTALERICAACGIAASTTARFCRACGCPLDPAAAPAPEAPARKTVTVLFADLAGSTAFEEAVDAETARDVIGRYHDLLRSTAQRHRAGVTKYIGDGFMAVWGVPEMGPDDAEHAVETAVELQELFVGLASHVSQAYAVDLALRVAVNTGEVVVGADDADLVGDALNVGARLESECPHGRVVVGEETWRSTRGRHRYDPLGAVSVKGRTAPVRVYQWLGRVSETADSIPFVGRSDELRRIRTVFDDAATSRSARLVTVTGDPGVGKTRLAMEFAGSLGRAHVLGVRCAVEGSPALVPLVEMLRARDLHADVPAGTAERDRILRDLTGMTAGVAGSVEETFWALRRFVEVLAVDAPVVLVMDDIQWADALLVDFLEHLVEWVHGVPVLIVALARPELREGRPDLVTVGGWVSEALHLGGLGARATGELAARVLGSGDLPADLLGRLPASTGGNPLFVRELVGMLVHDGVLVAGPTGWRLTLDVDAIAVPPTIQALLSSRLERLNAGDRRILEVASVVGTDFSPSAVAVLAGLGEAEVASALKRLRRVDLAEPSGTYAGDQPVWRFHHVLIRDVAYRRLLKSDRADLHEQLAEWVRTGGSSAAFESDEMIARHLEAAHGYRLDLGVRDEHTAGLALRSAQSYLASSRRALDRDELVSAGSQAARGAALARADSPLQADLLLVGCEAFLSAGDVAAGAPLVDELERIAGEPLAPWAICYRCQLVIYTDPTRLPEMHDRLQSAIDEFTRRKDAAGLAKAHRVRANARARLGRVGDCEVDLFEALIAARQGGDHRQITAALGAAPNAALWGPSPAPKAGGRCLDVVRMQRMTTAAPSLEATSLRCLAVLELLRGRPDKARSMLAEARQVVADLGLRHGLMETELFAGLIELMVGDPVAAEPHFRTALEGLDALGVGADAGQAAALLARSVLAQGRIEEADRYAAESERIAGHNLKTAIAWRAVRAEILSGQGRRDAAIALAREAVAVAADTDLVLDHAEACLALSRVLAAAGDNGGAAKAQRDAGELYRVKEAVLMIDGATPSVVPTTMPGLAAESRLALRNNASDTVETGLLAMVEADSPVDLAVYSKDVVYEDHRRVHGAPITDNRAFRAAALRKLEQYPHVDWRTVAVRGDRSVLVQATWSDDAGNETASLDVFELGDDALVAYHGRFDADDFESAYRELERRYYAGEGTACADSGAVWSNWVSAIGAPDSGTVERLTHPEFRWIATPSAPKTVERSIYETVLWLQERQRQVSFHRHWAASLVWLSPSCHVGRAEMSAVGIDGEEYRWSMVYVAECRDGLVAGVREFACEDEDAAFAYAESLLEQHQSRLEVANAASRVAEQVFDALRRHDAAAATALRSPTLTYRDRRRLSGGLTVGRDHLAAANTELVAQYSRFENRTLAVRGDRLWLGWSRWSDEDDNVATHLHVTELGDDGLFVNESLYEEDDFWAAYREMEERYYAGEGAPFAASGLATADWVISIGNYDLEGARRVSQPDFRWLAPPTALKASERSVEDMFHWMRERSQQVASQRNWVPVLRWLSRGCAVGLGHITAIGEEGEEYDWNFLFVGECRDGLMQRTTEFQVDDEEAAFAYADELVALERSRLSVQNAMSRAADRLIVALRAGDFDAVADTYADHFDHGDHRRVSGDPVTDRVGVRAAFERIFQLYSHFEIETLAVRGERLHLGQYRWSDDVGNQSIGFVLSQSGDDGRIVFQDRFEEDDFGSAYGELERRYYADDGAAYADAGDALTQIVLADNRGDLDGAFSMCLAPGFRMENRSRSPFPARTAEELRDSVAELGAMVASYRVWSPVMHWLSPDCVVALHHRAAVGSDGQSYEWARIYVGRIRDGLFTSLCEFDVDDEEAAFAYAEDRLRADVNGMSLTNEASQRGHSLIRALEAGDLAAATGSCSDAIVHETRRRFAGGRIEGLHDFRAAVAKLRAQYTHFDLHTVAVRGDRLFLARHCWFDDAGNRSHGYLLSELDDAGRFVYHCIFDEDDFDSAYRHLEQRYYAGEGARYALNGLKSVAFVEAMDRLDVEAARRLCHPSFTWFTPPSEMTAPERSLDEFYEWLRHRAAQVTAVKNYSSVYRWLSPDCFIALGDTRATGNDGEQYSWTRIYVGEFRDGLLVSMRQFEGQESAVAFAEERAREVPRRLAVSNRASDVGDALIAALNAGTPDAAIDLYSEHVVYRDRRQISGTMLTGFTAVQRGYGLVRTFHSHFEAVTVAVRGDNLALGRVRISDHRGNVIEALELIEVGDDGRIVFDATFDDDDFENAYQELDNRFYAGEGLAFAEPGMALAEYARVRNRGDIETLVRDLTTPDLRIHSRSHSVFVDRSAAEFRASLEELARLVTSLCEWLATIRWVSLRRFIAILQREAIGRDGERYEWTRIVVGEVRSGRLASVCDFDLDDEEAAFAYAEELAAQT